MNTLTEQINSVGKSFVDFAIPMLIQSGILILILLALDMLFRKRIRAVFRYWIWMIVLVKLVLPTTLSLPTSPAYWFGDKIHNVTQHKPMPKEPAAYSYGNIELSPHFYNIEPVEYKPITSLNTEERVAAPVIEQGISLSWQAIVFLIWFVLSLIMFVLLIQRTFFVKWLIKQSQKADEKLNAILERARLQMKLRNTVELRLSETAISPSVCGLFKPVILIPKALAEKINPNDLYAILLHELAHIKRFDLWVNLIQAILQIIYIYNPLLWIANIVIRNVREQAVDEMVLVTMGAQAEEYPKTLLNISKLSFGSAALSLRLIGVAESKKALFSRIKHITSRPFPGKAKLGVLGMILIIVLAVIMLPMAKSEKASAGQTNLNTIPDQQQRIYELIYTLRHYVMDVKTEEWVSAIKELTEIGSDAVPVLISELDRPQSHTNKYIRALAFTLRAIGDPRAVPALIRVLPNSSSGGSDMLVAVSDPNLLDFMIEHQGDQNETNAVRLFNAFSYGRPVREVTMTLEEITGHSEGHEHFHHYDSEGNQLTGMYDFIPEIQEKYRIEVAERWQKWWDEHWSEFVTEEQLASVYITSQKDEDIIENVGLAKFGQPFPTGEDVTLSPIVETILPVHIYYDSKSFLDLDTGRRFSNLEGAAPENRSDYTKWYKQVGVDVAGDDCRLIDGSTYNGLYNCGIKTWQIDNSRWESIEEEIRSSKSLDLGTIGPRSDFLPIDPQTREYQHKMRPVTFLFHTLHGTSGIMQITDPIDDPNGTHIKYRLIESPEQSIHKQLQKPVIYTTEYSQEGTLEPIVEKVVWKATSDIDSVLDLDTGKSLSIPEGMRGPSYPAKLFEWIESEGYDVCILSFKHPDGEVKTLTTCKVANISVSPELWDTITPNQLKDLIWKVDTAERYRVQGGMYVSGSTPKTYPAVFVFKTSQGATGILQIAGRTDDRQGLKIRYRLLQEN